MGDVTYQPTDEATGTARAALDGVPELAARVAYQDSPIDWAHPPTRWGTDAPTWA